MSNYKALISKNGEILSLSEEGPDGDNTTLDIAADSKYPDAVFVNAADNQEAQEKVKEILRKAAAEHKEEHR